MDEHKIRIGRCIFEVSEEFYIDFYREKERSKYLRKERNKYITFSYNALDTDGFNGEEAVADRSVDVESTVVKRIMIEKLRSAMMQLTAEELALIHALFFEEKSEREVSNDSGVPVMTLNDRKRRILMKLKKIIGN